MGIDKNIPKYIRSTSSRAIFLKTEKLKIFELSNACPLLVIRDFKQTDAATNNQISIQKDQRPSELSQLLTSITLNSMEMDIEEYELVRSDRNRHAISVVI